MPVISKLKTRREASGLTQHDLADKAGVSVKTISRAEAGRGVILTVAKAVERVLAAAEKRKS